MSSPLSHRAAACAALFLAVGAAALSGCSAPTATEPTATPTASIVAIGHSGLTGVGSDPDSLGSSVLANSWATGTNPEVQSVYLRMRADDPGLVAFNFAMNGSDVKSLITQARAAVEVEPAPRLIIVQSVANDIRCDGSDPENHEPFRERLTRVMDILTSGAPDAEVFVVSQWGTVQKFVDVMSAVDPALQTGAGMCGVIGDANQLVASSRIAEVQGLVDDYEQIVSDVCAEYENCVWDRGAQRDMEALEVSDLANDYVHLSESGHHKMAEIAWRDLEG